MIWSSTMTKTAIAVAGLGLGALALNAYTAHIKADAESAATQKANTVIINQANSTIASKQAQIDQLLKGLQQSEADKATLQAAVNKKYQQIKTPQQAAIVTAQNLGVPTSEIKTGGTAQNPTLEVPQKPALDYQQACDTCQLNLRVLTQQFSYSEQIRKQQEDQLSAKDQKIGALSSDLDKANKAAKGGTWLQRTGRALKYIGIGAAIGGAAICGSGHCK